MLVPSPARTAAVPLLCSLPTGRTDRKGGWSELTSIFWLMLPPLFYFSSLLSPFLFLSSAPSHVCFPPPTLRKQVGGDWRAPSLPLTRTVHPVCPLPAAGTPAQILALILLLSPDPRHTYLPSYLHPSPKPLPFWLLVDAPGSVS
jgi:hypothetical protein